MERNEAIEVIKRNYPHVTESGSQFETALRLLIPELKESEDERIRKQLIVLVKSSLAHTDEEINEMIAWLEKQGEQNPVDFSDLRTWKYIVDAVLTEKEGIGQYLDSPFTEEVVKKLQKRFGNIEQKSADKIQLGKKYRCIASPRYSTFMTGETYKPEDKFLCSLMNFCSDCFEPVEDGEQKSAEWHREDEQNLNACLGYIPDEFLRRWLTDIIHVKYDKSVELPKGEDYGIDGLYAAIDILQKTLGDVDGYQSDDGILEHKCAISAVKKLYEQKPWSEEDEKEVTILEAYIRSNDWSESHIDRALGIVDELVNKVKSLRPQFTWKPSDEQMDAVKSAALDVAKFSSRSEQLRLENEPYYKALMSLYNDLEKLREE